MFDIFDHDTTITLVSVTPGYTDSSGGWVPEVTETSTINGHITDLTYEERQFVPTGIVEKGVRKLATSANLDVGDRIQIGSEEYTIYEQMHTNYLIGRHTGETRTTYLITK
jgi:hypothetical protein